ncbi:MAG: hypothetical protein V3W41_18850 [Planctomycetota bacterium]
MDAEILISDQALNLGGFVLAHAAWSISDADDGALLVPLLVVEKSGERRMSRFEAETQEEAIACGFDAIDRLGDDVEVWAFAREALMKGEDESHDALVVHVWAKGMSDWIMILQAYKPINSERPFQLNSQFEVVIGDATVEDAALAPLSEEIDRGINDHPQAALMWNHWLEV